MASTFSVTAIVTELKELANEALSEALGSTPLEAFAVTDLGNFPYNWQDTRDRTRFNRLTYDWVATNLKAGATPLQQDASFAKLYVQALANITWWLSMMDQANLNRATSAAARQASEVMNAWIRAFGVFYPLDEIAGIIATSWAGNQPTSLMDIQSAPAPHDLLNLTPAAGWGVIHPFLNWLNALGGAVPQQNSVSLAKGYLRLAMKAAQDPWTDSGLTLSDGSIVPRYQVVNQTSDIRHALLTGPAVAISIAVRRRTSDEFRLSISDGKEFGAPLGFLSIGVSDNADYFASDVAVADNQTTVTLKFPGVNLVTLGPVPFERTAPNHSWYWIEPILQAIKNAGRDVSGFRFKAQPGIDFSRSGPFGHIRGVAISAYPTITITVNSASWQKIRETFQRTFSSSVSFLGVKLAGSTGQGYSNAVTVDAANSTVTITMSPPQPSVSDTDIAARAWVLGVQPDYPAA